MGSGYHYSSSSSSSNLSPLAPPFTVDRSHLHTNPSPTNTPSYPPSSSSFTSSLPFSQSTGVPRYYNDSSNEYGYIVSEPVVDPPISRNWEIDWSGVNPNAKGTADSLFYDVGEGSAVGNDVPVAPLLSFSDGIGYARSLNGLEYDRNPKPKQGGVSSRLSLGDEKRVDGMGNGGGFGLQEANVAGSFTYNTSLNQGVGVYCTEGLSTCKDDASSLYYADMIKRANNNGKSDGASFSANVHGGFGSNEFTIEESHFKAFPAYSESHASVIQSHEDPFWNSQKLNSSCEKRYHNMFEDRMLKSKKSTLVVIKYPAAKAKSLVTGKTAGVSKVRNVAGGSSINASKEKEEFHLPQLSFQIGTTDATPLKKDTKLSSASDQPKFEFKAKLPDINIPDAANSFDHHNPAEDSPCWKGTPSLPFGSFQTQPSTKKLQKDTNLQETDYSNNINEKTSSSPIPLHNETGEIVDSLKMSDGGDDAIKLNKSETSKFILPNIEETARLPADMYGEAADKKLNASKLVKEVYNLSELLLQACSKEALDEHDYESLDHVTRNLGVCMLKRVEVTAASTSKQMLPHLNFSQEVINETSGTLQAGTLASSRKLMSPINGESVKNLRDHAFHRDFAENEINGTFQDGGQHAHNQKMKSDAFIQSVKNLQGHASLRNLDPPIGDNMVQAIKKVLDENLECQLELSSEATLLYKNMWLEAEAELCCASYRARFERLKRETQKEKPHKSTATGDVSGTTLLKADNSKVSNAQHTGDVINVYPEQNPIKEGHTVAAKVTGSGVTVQHQHCKARMNTNKHIGKSNFMDLGEGLCGEDSESHSQDQEEASAVGEWVRLGTHTQR